MADELRAVVAKATAGLTRTFSRDVKVLDNHAYEEVIDLEVDGARDGQVTPSSTIPKKRKSGLHLARVLFATVILLGAFLVFNVPSTTSAIAGKVTQDRPEFIVKAPRPTGGGRPAPRKAVVFGSELADDGVWATKLPSEWIVNPARNESQLATPLGVALPYLDWLIDNYRSLPAYVVFAQGDYQSWHQPTPLPDLVRAIDLDAIDEQGWLSLRCSSMESCMSRDSAVETDSEPPGDDWLAYLVRGIYLHIYRPEDSWYPDKHLAGEPAGQHIPAVFSAPTGSQFAVSRLAVWSKPLVYWERVREPLLMKTEEMDAWWPGQHFSAEQVEAAYEHLWHYLFLMEPVACVEEEYCRQSVYQGHINCSGEDGLSEASTRQDVEALGCGYQD